MDTVINHELAQMPQGVRQIIENYARWTPSDMLILISPDPAHCDMDMMHQSGEARREMFMSYSPKISAFAWVTTSDIPHCSFTNFLTCNELDECMWNSKSEVQFKWWLDDKIDCQQSEYGAADTIDMEDLRECYRLFLMGLTCMIAEYWRDARNTAELMYSAQ